VGSGCISLPHFLVGRVRNDRSGNWRFENRQQLDVIWNNELVKVGVRARVIFSVEVVYSLQKTPLMLC